MHNRVRAAAFFFSYSADKLQEKEDFAVVLRQIARFLYGMPGMIALF